jgi:putative spermidine/putrescine transport system ATP-binding protein
VLEQDPDWATLVLPDGAVIRGRCGRGLRNGEEAMLALRPERAHIASAEGILSAADTNLVTARVEELVYCGDHHRVHLKLGAQGSGDSLIVKVPNTQHHDLPSLGSATAVAWRHDDCKILATAVTASHGHAPSLTAGVH